MWCYISQCRNSWVTLRIQQCILKAFTSLDYPKLFFNKAVLPVVGCSVERIVELSLNCFLFLNRLFLQEKESLKLGLRKVDKQENMPC